MVLGVYTDPVFLDGHTCLRIRRAMDAGEAESADVLRESIERHDEVRRASYVDVPHDVLSEVETRLEAQRAPLAAFFGVPLTSREGAGLVRYPEGGFYRQHRDRADVPSWPQARLRRVAVVVFLNDNFSGGILRLLDDDPVDLSPQAGMLVAFPADRLHEVTVVGGGPRDAIVDWFY